MESLLNRRSIRRYTSQSVSDETIQDILHAAMSAPSATNQRPWHFVVIRDRAVLDTIPTVHPYAFMVKEAPLVIAVCVTDKLGDFAHFREQDCAAATQNILTAVVEKGLGGVWLGVYPKQSVSEIHSLLKLPPHITPFSLIAIGHPAEHIPGGNRYDQSRVHYDTW